MACGPRIKCHPLRDENEDDDDDDDDDDDRECARDAFPRVPRRPARLARRVTTFSKHNGKLRRAANDSRP